MFRRAPRYLQRLSDSQPIPSVGGHAPVFGWWSWLVAPFAVVWGLTCLIVSLIYEAGAWVRRVFRR